MTTVAACARNSTHAEELSFDRVAIVINAQYVICCRLTCVSIAHLRKHLLATRGRAYVEYAGYSSVSLAKRAVAFMTEKGRELSIVVLVRLDTVVLSNINV